MDPIALKPLYLTLQRYAGWLDRERGSVIVRAAVEALGSVMATGADPSPLLHTLDADLARLPSGAVRKMLRTAAGQFRRALESPDLS
jgi:hypothetical protein